jgi:hypothetical protein
MKRSYKSTSYTLIGVVASLLVTVTVLAGSIDSPGEPTDPASQMYTLQQIYDRINNGEGATKMTTFSEPDSAPGSTMKTLDDLYDLASQRSRPPETRQTACYQVSSGDSCTCGEDSECPTGQDGELQKGVAWPGTRFTDNSDGTVTDNLTGLIWLKNANCWGSVMWDAALLDANGQASGNCGLADGSSAGDWRLPNVRELQSLVDYGRFSPALPEGHPFTGVQTGSTYYWSSTSRVSAMFYGGAWGVSLFEGAIDTFDKSLGNYVWPVRGGQ